jgi:hypothetical protein
LYGELLDAFAEGRDRGAPPDAKLAGTNTATDPV